MKTPTRWRMKMKRILALLSLAWSKWNDHNAPRLGAALAYYALLSAAPLLILVLEISGLVLNRTVAEQELFEHTANLLGSGAAQMLRAAIDNAHHKTGIVASSLAGLALLLGASGIFVELRDALNTIWDAPVPQQSAIRGMITQRLAAIAMILCLGIFITASLIASTAFALVQKYFSSLIPVRTAIFGEVLNILVSVIIVAVLFVMVFKFVPNVPIDWRDVSIGALVSAVFFMIGKSLLALYLNTAGVGSAYGAAGSLVAFVAWVYYSAQIFLFGAIFTRVYADHYGSYARHRRRKESSRAAGAASGS